MERQDERTQLDTEAQLQSVQAELSITTHAWKKLMAYCRAASPNEVSGFIVIEQDDNELLVTDCYITDQISTPSSTEIETPAIGKLFQELRLKGILDKENVRVGHFHTHPTFNVFWSATDMELRRILRKGCEWYVSLVLNNKGEALAALDINGEFPVEISSIPIMLLPEPATPMEKACKQEVEAKVKGPAQIERYQEDDWRPGNLFDERPSDVLRRTQMGLENWKPRRAVKDGVLETEAEAMQEIADHLHEGETFPTDTALWMKKDGKMVKVQEVPLYD